VNIRTELKGLKETQKRLTDAVRELAGPGLIQPMRNATLLVQRSARQNAPVDTGRLRASIMPEVRTMSDTVEGVVGSNVVYAPYMELGTRPHYPPVAALSTWAHRHSINAYAVVRAIGKRGLAPRHFLQRAFVDNAARVVKLLGDGVSAIIRKANNQ
jgi:hypothetical protein